ncbi:alpha/beta fold hydrolase [Pseudooceanicola onchidii]|uniref:alpha/beta fold hydrolase n=1 Tax=Pseudooceanicola onchidii TaxID=2562279 RepID=UPI0010AA4FEE|nr:alpha/beta hydrolase [Pseudooceanicola onchidii]
MPHFPAADGTRIHYTDTGEGIPLLCLSGLTRNGRDFDFVAPHLADMRLICMDYRGRGQSDWADFKTYDVGVEAQDVLALLDHLGLDRVAVLGTSRGGLIAMVLAALAKDRLIGIALNDVGPVIEPAGLAAIQGYLGQNPGFATLKDAADARTADTSQFRGVSAERWIRFLGHVYDETPEGLKINYDPGLYDAVAPAFDAEPADAWPLFDGLAGLPLAIIHGANSDLLSRATVEEMSQRHPGAVVAHVPDRGHIPFLDEPEALAALAAWKGQLA